MHLKRLFKLKSHKFGLKFVCNQVTISKKFTFLENRPQNSIINKTYSFCLILLKFWYKPMSTLMHKWLKFQPFYAISSEDITSFMCGTYKKSHCRWLRIGYTSIVLERTYKSLALSFLKLDNLQFYENAFINSQCFCFLCQKSVKSAKTKAWKGFSDEKKSKNQKEPKDKRNANHHFWKIYPVKLVYNKLGYDVQIHKPNWSF